MKTNLFLVSTMLIVSPAIAATISIGGVSVPGMGQVSSFAGATQFSFDAPGGGCDVSAVGPAQSGQTLVGAGTTPHLRLAPANDTSCYASVGPLNGVPGVYSTSFGVGDKYIGFYWGSMDEYNSVEFFDAATGGNPITFDGFASPVITGSDIAAKFPTSRLYSSNFVNFNFVGSPIPQRVQFSSTYTSFEFDNVAVSTSGSTVSAPEPGAFALLLGGVVAAAAARKRLRARE